CARQGGYDYYFDYW
nr:immunoglobulin heavy chain junction region [Mus musculus]MBK4183920.1 immunoglobulin heavy chain junction region [Mus musculus]MBK4190080.1 immunoglobulin heavy chain junction region [Mus musculus]